MYQILRSAVFNSFRKIFASFSRSFFGRKRAKLARGGWAHPGG